MTSLSAVAYLNNFIKSGNALGGIVISADDKRVYLLPGTVPMEIGLQPQVDNPEHLGDIIKKIKERAEESLELITLTVKEEDDHTYFYDEPNKCRFILIRKEAEPSAEIDAEEIDAGPRIPFLPSAVVNIQEIPIETPVVAQTPEEHDLAFQEAQTCPFTRLLMRIWKCMTQALTALIRCLCCRFSA